ncbi:MAG: HAMP domain-containing protein [Elusimicrobia bacterium]|nr:HAMP domain-containing protein [Elusimicrobiota bacterium]
MNLFTRFFLILFLFAMLPVAALGLWMMVGREAVRDNSHALHLRLAALTADLAGRTLEQLNKTLLVVEDVERARGAAALERSALQRAAAADPNVALISILDAAGLETARVGDPELFPDLRPADRAGEPVLAEARQSGRVSIGAASLEAGAAMVPVVHPLADGRFLYVKYTLRSLTRRLQKLSKAGGGGGRLLFTGETGRPLPGVGDEPPSADWTLAHDGDEGWSDRVPSPAGPWVAASVRVPALGWRAVSLQPRREAYAESEAAATRAVIFLLVIIVVVTLGAFGLSSRLLQPVTALMGAAERISKNDFSRPIPPLGWGELDRLGKTFNSMSEKVGLYQGLQIEKIMEEKARIDALVRNIPGGVLLAGLDGSVLYQNGTAAKILESAGGDGAQKVRELVKQPQRQKLLDGVVLVEMKGAADAKSYYACQALKVARDTRELGVLILMRDVTVERELELMKEDFFHGLVHDLRGPISVIDGIVFILQKHDTLEAKDKKYVGLANEATKRLSLLVANILDLAKLESGTMTMNLKPVSPAALITPVHTLFQVPAETKNVTLTMNCESGWEVNCDAPLLERVLMNLVGNSLKFTPKGGRIELGARKTPAGAEFWVKDTGPGIPPDKLAAVFEKFSQLDRDTAARAGYGLGLSICTKIVERHKGRIWVESEGEGKGSRFALSVPL